MNFLLFPSAGIRGRHCKSTRILVLSLTGKPSTLLSRRVVLDTALSKMQRRTEMHAPKLSKQPPHTSPSLPQRYHGVQQIRGIEDVPRSTLYEGRFGRMFRRLPPCPADNEDLQALAALMFERRDQSDVRRLDNPAIPAGFTYFGQFVDHDITFDPNSKLQRDNDPDALRNFRTPRYDLDSLYGDGPDNNPFLYYRPEPKREPYRIHLLVGRSEAKEDDLPRSNGRALIGDPRNDENAIVSQLHLAFIKFHNLVVDSLPETPDRFDEARRIVRWHYQWVVVHDFLGRILGGEAVINDIIKLEKYSVPFGDGTKDIQGALNVDLKFYDYRNQPFIPVEFSVAAYRFGHSMVRTDYELNKQTEDPNDVDIFGDEGEDLRGFKERRPGLEIEWDRFFEFPGRHLEPQASRRIDTKLAAGLSKLPEITDGLRSLAERNLLRGKALGLPSGQAIGRAMGMPDDVILSAAEMDLPENMAAAFSDNTPLWFYILKEAEVRCNGEHLGPVGGRIVAEVLIGLLAGDPSSYLSAEPTWQPKKRQFGCKQDGKYSIADLLGFAGVKIS
jgi:Animal haem peroxidase